MQRYRSVSTLVGALIALAAIVSVIASASYLMRVMSVTEASIGRLSAQRMNEWLEMYSSTLVSKNLTNVCFETPNDEMLVEKVVVVKGGRPLVYNSRCIPAGILESASDVVLVSRAGALLELPAKLLVGIKGVVPIRELVSGVVNGFENNVLDIEPWSMVGNARLEASDAIHLFVSIGFNQKPPEGGYYATLLAVNNSVGYAYASMLPATLGLIDTTLGLTWWKAPLAFSGGNRVAGMPPYILHVDNGTICVYERLAAYTPYPTVSGFDYILCVTRGVLRGNVVVNSTFVWLSSPLGSRLVKEAVERGSVTVWLGPSTGIVPVFIVAERTPTGVSYSLATPDSSSYLVTSVEYGFTPLAEATKPAEEAGGIHFAPLVYRLLRVSPQAFELETEPTGRVATSPAMPYYDIFISPLAYVYQEVTGQPLQLYTLYALGPNETYLATLYTPGFFTYVEPAPGTTCKLLRLNWKPPIPGGDAAWVPGLVCMKIGEYNAMLHYTLYTIDLVEYTFKVQQVYSLKAPGELIACYYPAVLACNGTVYVYYSFAPSMFYNPESPALKLLDEIAEKAVALSSSYSGSSAPSLEDLVKAKFLYALQPLVDLGKRVETSVASRLLRFSDYLFEVIASAGYCSVEAIEVSATTQFYAAAARTARASCKPLELSGVGMIVVRDVEDMSNFNTPSQIFTLALSYNAIVKS